METPITQEDINEGVQKWKNLVELPLDSKAQDVWAAYSEAAEFMDTVCHSKDENAIKTFSEGLLKSGVIEITIIPDQKQSRL